MYKFSIIIPVRQINDFLKESIPHLKDLNYANFEVLIIADAKEAYDFKDTRFKIIPSGSVGPGEKRNIGAKNAQGDILAFLDDDAYPTKNWLKEASILFESDKDLYALGAPAMTPLNGSLLEKVSGRILESYLTSGFTFYRHIPSKRRFINDYPTVNLFVKKESFDKVGGFDKEFWPGEDTKLCLDLVKKYKRDFLYDPKPQVFHHRRNIFIPHLKQISRYGRYRGQFVRLFPETSFVPSYFVPLLFILGLFLGPLVCYFIPILWDLYFGVILIYLILLVLEGIKASIKDKNLLTFIFFVIGVFLTHVFYGINFLIGFIKRPKLKLRDIDKETGNYLSG